ncbi:MAG: pyridoxamine 5'-phosphate oxidase family protein [Saprospiraceae bacterium]|nr:pyridoxamine 5'-phosphate oxidase family protein [Saprospiraceae bacterium]
MIILDSNHLRELYSWPAEIPQNKVMSKLEQHGKNFLSHSPFMLMSTYDTSGKVDTSPRGGEPGFVKILDDQTLLLPDAHGNNRVDSLINIVETGRVGCLFLIPGIDETLRLNGSAVVTNDESYLSYFQDLPKAPKTVVKITIEEVFLHCAKALMRSKLWGPEYRLERPGFPTLGQMLKDQLSLTATMPSQEEMVEIFKKEL